MPEITKTAPLKSCSNDVDCVCVVVVVVVVGSIFARFSTGNVSVGRGASELAFILGGDNGGAMSSGGDKCFLFVVNVVVVVVGFVVVGFVGVGFWFVVNFVVVVVVAVTVVVVVVGVVVGVGVDVDVDVVAFDVTSAVVFASFSRNAATLSNNAPENANVSLAAPSAIVHHRKLMKQTHNK